MTKAIFAGKNIEKFPFNEFVTIFRTLYTKFTYLFKNFFLGNSPGNAGNGQGHYKQIINMSFHNNQIRV